MAMTIPSWRVTRVSFTTAEPAACSAFFREALGFEEFGIEERGGEAFGRLMGLSGARAQIRLLRLGQQEVELVAFAEKGRFYPPGGMSSDPWFQHIAIVVSDMQAAYTRLTARPGWTPISTSGPQRLPDSSGGVTAFKFRDPEGHPLELIAFPPGRTPKVWQGPHGADPCLGIDHSAIVVSSSAVSIAFYQQLGFRLAARSLNRGTEQEKLDAISGTEVEVTRLQHAGMDDPPQLELLCYRSPSARHSSTATGCSNDIATTRLLLDARPGIALAPVLAQLDMRLVSDGAVAVGGGRKAALLHDPDAHHLMLIS
ncbi:glyoxalase [Dankookia rubra]|uniref:Glyoxalase n=1 Tax=Dankookia rubra TaxID=1442381 RepID=A0A4R5QBZ4_9PROT|nr:VOC family protein [Dankookia rubra]TDH60119.1 glyoxalase [Dankookia rubra]